MTDEQGQTRGAEPTSELHDEAAIWAATYAERARKLRDLQKRLAWFGEALGVARREGKIKSGNVRFFMSERQPLLLDEDGEPALDADGEAQYDWDAEPFYFATVQAWSYVGDPPLRTVAGTMDVALQLLDRGWSGTVLDVLCGDLNASHARELAKFHAHATTD